MPKLSFESYPHEKELSFGLDSGFSRYYGNFRLSISLLFRTYYINLDWETKNV